MLRQLRTLLSFALMTTVLVILPTGVGHAAAACTAMSADAMEIGNPTRGSTLYTLYQDEVDGAVGYGFVEDRGAPFAVSPVAAPGMVPVHRLYHPSTGDFVWMTSGAERSNAVEDQGYVDEGAFFFVSDSAAQGCVPVVRFVKGDYHRFAVTADDQQTLLDDGWAKEGIAFYARPTETGPDTPPPPPGPPATGTDPNFTFAVLPDTQDETTSTDGRFAQRTKWLADNKAALDLRWALHSGDVVNWGWLAPSQYAVASEAMKNLETAQIPYSLAIGNHDTRAVGWNGVSGSTGYGGAAYAANPECPIRLGVTGCNTNDLVRQTQEFNATFTAARYGTTTVAYEPGKVDNIYQTYSAGGVNWLVLTLELWPRAGVVSWAQSIVAAHPKHNVIVVTHHYLNGDGSISGSNGGYGATSGQYLYENLIKVYPNVKMVFSGHVGAAASRTDVGINGNTVYSFLETFHSTSNPVRLVTVDTAAKTIATKIYAPKTDETFSAYSQTFTGVTFVAP